MPSGRRWRESEIFCYVRELHILVSVLAFIRGMRDIRISHIELLDVMMAES